MSKLIIGFFNAEQVAALRAAGHSAETVGVTMGDHVVSIIKASPIGAKIVDAIHTIKDGKNDDGTPMTGFQKLEHVAVNDALPLVTSFVADGGVTLVNSAKDTAVAAVTSIYNDLHAGVEEVGGDLAGGDPAA